MTSVQYPLKLSIALHLNTSRVAPFAAHKSLAVDSFMLNVPLSYNYSISVLFTLLGATLRCWVPMPSTALPHNACCTATVRDTGSAIEIYQCSHCECRSCSSCCSGNYTEWDMSKAVNQLTMAMHEDVLEVLRKEWTRETGQSLVICGEPIGLYTAVPIHISCHFKWSQVGLYRCQTTKAQKSARLLSSALACCDADACLHSLSLHFAWLFHCSLDCLFLVLSLFDKPVDLSPKAHHPHDF